MKTETLLKVDGMTCRSCVNHVGEALREVAGVAEVDVRLRAGQVLVAHDPGTSVDALIAALQAAGYDARAAQPTEPGAEPLSM